MNLNNVLYKIARRGKSLLPQEVQDKIYKKILSLQSSSLSEVGELERFNPSSADLLANEEIISDQYKYFGQKITSSTWFVPYIPFPYYGGILTIYRFCDYLISQGINTRVSVRGCPKISQADYAQCVRNLFPNLANLDMFFQEGIDDVNQIPESDISFATDWPSAYSSLLFNKTKVKYYFVQDYEPLCYEASATSGLAELTYKLGFIPIVNTQGLHSYYTSRHIVEKSTFFNPAVDRNIFHDNDRIESDSLPTRIFYYCRPNSGRNGFTLGISALKKVKEKWENRVDIVLAGSIYEDPLIDQYASYFNKLGLLPYQETGNLYRRCHIGLVTMYTPHTSYLPLELMACGVSVVTNRSDAKDWLIKDNHNGLYANPLISSVEEKISFLIKNPDMRRQISKNSSDYLSKFSWEQSLDKVYQFLVSG